MWTDRHGGRLGMHNKGNLGRNSISLFLASFFIIYYAVQSQNWPKCVTFMQISNGWRENVRLCAIHNSICITFDEKMFIVLNCENFAHTFVLSSIKLSTNFSMYMHLVCVCVYGGEVYISSFQRRLHCVDCSHTSPNFGNKWTCLSVVVFFVCFFSQVE